MKNIIGLSQDIHEHTRTRAHAHSSRELISHPPGSWKGLLRSRISGGKQKQMREKVLMKENEQTGEKDEKMQNAEKEQKEKQTNGEK